MHRIDPLFFIPDSKKERKKRRNKKNIKKSHYSRPEDSAISPLFTATHANVWFAWVSIPGRVLNLFLIWN